MIYRDPAPPITKREKWIYFAVVALVWLAYVLVLLPWRGDAQKKWSEVAADFPPVEVVDYAPGHYDVKYFVLAAGPEWVQQAYKGEGSHPTEPRTAGEWLAPAMDNACTRFHCESSGIYHYLPGEDGKFVFSETRVPGRLVCFFHPISLEKIPEYDHIDHSAPCDSVMQHLFSADVGLAAFSLLLGAVLLTNWLQALLLGSPRRLWHFVLWYLGPALVLTLYFLAVGLMDRNFDHSPVYFQPHIYWLLIPFCFVSWLISLGEKRA